jgi:hypothetical protein
MFLSLAQHSLGDGYVGDLFDIERQQPKIQTIALDCPDKEII